MESVGAGSSCNKNHIFSIMVCLFFSLSLPFYPSYIYCRRNGTLLVFLTTRFQEFI